MLVVEILFTNDIELKIMEADILEAQALGADAVCIGALTADGQSTT